MMSELFLLIIQIVLTVRSNQHKVGKKLLDNIDAVGPQNLSETDIPNAVSHYLSNFVVE